LKRTLEVAFSVRQNVTDAETANIGKNSEARAREDRCHADCPSPCDKLARRAKFRFAKTPNQWPISGHPVPTRGAVARRHERGMGCGGRESVGAQLISQGGLNPVSDPQARRTNDAKAYGKTVWF
jgi:hypothetical protein